MRITAQRQLANALQLGIAQRHDRVIPPADSHRHLRFNRMLRRQTSASSIAFWQIRLHHPEIYAEGTNVFTIVAARSSKLRPLCPTGVVAMDDRACGIRQRRDYLKS